MNYMKHLSTDTDVSIDNTLEVHQPDIIILDSQGVRQRMQRYLRYQIVRLSFM